MNGLQRAEEFISIAQEVALKSECVRRKYGVVIYRKDGTDSVTGANVRVSRCCNNDCARERFDVKHGQNTELGAEVHAEQAALISWKGYSADDWDFIIAGYDAREKRLASTQLYPCYVCARMIKYAGFKIIYLQREDETIIPVTLEQILEYREQEWVDVVTS